MKSTVICTVLLLLISSPTLANTLISTVSIKANIEKFHYEEVHPIGLIQMAGEHLYGKKKIRVIDSINIEGYVSSISTTTWREYKFYPKMVIEFDESLCSKLQKNQLFLVAKNHRDKLMISGEMSGFILTCLNNG